MVLGVGGVSRRRNHALADGKPAHALSDLGDLSGCIGAQDVRKRELGDNRAFPNVMV